MTTNNLTDRNFWEKYWQNYKYSKVPENIFFDKYIKSEAKDKTFIEIGGFPGTMAIYFAKKYDYKTTLLDFYIDKAMVNKMEELNEVAENSVECIEGDFFAFKSKKEYDCVFSYGFIEHFEDTADVIQRHIDLLAPDGNLLIILPNFRGLNGFIQRIFDRENYNAHNLSSMGMSNLQAIMNKFDLLDVKIDYTPKPILWLEPKPKKWNKIARSFVKTLSYGVKLFPITGKFLSPYIIITAKKQIAIGIK